LSCAIAIQLQYDPVEEGNNPFSPRNKADWSEVALEGGFYAPRDALNLSVIRASCAGMQAKATVFRVLGYRTVHLMIRFQRSWAPQWRLLASWQRSWHKRITRDNPAPVSG
jgi:hypothetical protein